MANGIFGIPDSGGSPLTVEESRLLGHGIQEGCEGRAVRQSAGMGRRKVVEVVFDKPNVVRLAHKINTCYNAGNTEKEEVKIVFHGCVLGGVKGKGASYSSS